LVSDPPLISNPLLLMRCFRFDIYESIVIGTFDIFNNKKGTKNIAIGIMIDINGAII